MLALRLRHPPSFALIRVVEIAIDDDEHNSCKLHGVKNPGVGSTPLFEIIIEPYLQYVVVVQRNEKTPPVSKLLQKECTYYFRNVCYIEGKLHKWSKFTHSVTHTDKQDPELPRPRYTVRQRSQTILILNLNVGGYIFQKFRERQKTAVQFSDKNWVSIGALRNARY